jgi:hypothetical protein
MLCALLKWIYLPLKYSDAGCNGTASTLPASHCHPSVKGDTGKKEYSSDERDEIIDLQQRVHTVIPFPPKNIQ